MTVLLWSKHVQVLALVLNTMHFFSKKHNPRKTENESHLVGKLAISFRYLTSKWESNHQTGCGGQPVKGCNDIHNIVVQFK